MNEGTIAKELLFQRWPTASDLREEFSYKRNSLNGEFETKDGKPFFKVYKNGNVASRPLCDVKNKINPTVGIILAGSYEFETGDNEETLVCLDGIIYASINNGPISIVSRDVGPVAPAGSILRVQVSIPDKYAFYHCRYQPRNP